MSQSTKLVTKDYLEELAKDKKNLVYHYEYDQPKYKFTAVQRQECMKQMRAQYVIWKGNHESEYNQLDATAQETLEAMFALKRRRDEGKEDITVIREEEKKLKEAMKNVKHRLHTLDNDGRTHIRQENSLLDRFATDHEKIVYTLTSHTTSEEHVQHLRYMVYLQVEQEKGNLSEGEAQAMVQDYLVSKFKTEQTLAEYQQELAAKEAAENKEK